MPTGTKGFIIRVSFPIHRAEKSRPQTGTAQEWLNPTFLAFPNQSGDRVDRSYSASRCGGVWMSRGGNAASDLETARSGLLIMVFGSCLGLGRLSGCGPACSTRVSGRPGRSDWKPLRRGLRNPPPVGLVRIRWSRSGFRWMGAILAFVASSRLLRESHDSTTASRTRKVALSLVAVGLGCLEWRAS